MDKPIKPGRVIFATGILGLGILCIVFKDFIVGRPPAWPAGINPNPALAYLSAAALVVAALAVLLAQKAGAAALCIAALIFGLSVLRHLPHFMEDWANTYKSMALCGGALIVAASFLKREGLRKNLVLAGCISLAAFLIACGYAHFKFAEFVTTLIPSFIPFPVFWTYFAGVCLLAGGAGLLIPQTRRWAALLCGIMVLGWFILLHIPRFLANTHDASDRMGLCESFAFVGIFFVLAGTLPAKK
jgi:uncharacterized membrane protein